MPRKRYLVLGDGAAGMTAAQTLRHADRTAAIAIVSDDPNPAYFRAALTNYLLGELREEQIWAVPPSFYVELGLERMLDRATSVDAARGRVWLASGGAPLCYDALLVGTGARARPPTFEGAELPGVATMRTLQDVRWVMDLVSLQGLRRAVVIGGGPLALEWAHALRERGVEVVMLVRETRFLVGALDGVASDLLLARMRQSGLVVHLGEEVTGATAGRDGRLAAVVTRSGRTVACELCAVAIGVQCNTEFLRGSGVELTARGGVVVDRRMKSSAQAIFAAGDCAELEGKLDQKWEPARRQGQVAGLNMAGAERAYAPGSEYFATRLYDLDFASIGKVDGAPAEGFEELVDHKKSTGRISYRKLVLQGGKVKGALMLGEREERVRQNGKLFKRLIDEGLDVGAIRSDLLDSGFDLNGWLRSKSLTDKPRATRAVAIPGGAASPGALPANAILRGTRAIDIAQIRALAGAQAAAGGGPGAMPPMPQPPAPRRQGAMLSIGLRIPGRDAPSALAGGAAASLEGAGRRWDLGASVVSIGREASCTVVLTDPAVSHLHAQITSHESRRFLRDLGSKTGTWVNDGRVTVPHPLRDADRIRLGVTELTFRTSAQLPAAPPPPPSFASATPADPATPDPVHAAPAAPLAAQPAAPASTQVRMCLEVTAGQSSGLAFALEGTSVTIGRDLGCALRLDDLSISRRHCLLSEFGGRWHVSDLHSSRGTFRNGERLPPGQDVALAEGDRLELGDAQLLLRRRRS